MHESVLAEAVELLPHQSEVVVAGTDRKPSEFAVGEWPLVKDEWDGVHWALPISSADAVQNGLFTSPIDQRHLGACTT
jgi:hypothetical protein